MIRKAKKDDLQKIADLHIEAFPNFFLTKLGRRFLIVMYLIFMDRPGSIFLVCERYEKLVGLVVGMPDYSGGDFSFVRSYALLLLFSLLDATIRNPCLVAHRITSKIFFFKNEPKLPTNSMIIRSICVSSNVRGSGLGSELLYEFERIAKRNAYNSLVLTTDAVNNENVIDFYRRNGFELYCEFNQTSKRKMHMLKKNLFYSEK